MSAKTGPVDTRGWNINTHGSVGYSRGCRCETCRSARAESVRAQRAAAAARRIAAEAAGQVYVAKRVRHGSVSGYKNGGCRCPACCQAAMDYRRGVYKPPSATPAAVTPCVRCKSVQSDGTCCSSHNVLLCHRCYRRTHFVERCPVGCERCAREGLDPMKWPTPVAAGRAS